MKRLLLASASVCLVLGSAAAVSAQGASSRPAAKAAQPTGQPAVAQPLSPELRTKLLASLERGAAYLRQHQAADGRWERHPGVTGMAVTALLRMPGTTPAGQMTVVGKSLDGLAALAKPDGGIYEKDIPHYITAVAAMAMVAGGRPQDKPLIQKAGVYLSNSLLDERQGVSPSDKYYGGASYGGARADERADIISLEYALRGMKEAELPANNAAWEKALKFIQRTQNNSETNDQGWASNDGGFVYLPGFSENVAGGTLSYGSASYAGLLSYVWADIKKEDPRVQSVLKWVRNNYTVDENPGMGQKTVYYYYMVFAKALHAVGEPVIVDAKGQRHNWREDLGRKLIALQHPEGFWVNTVPDEMQDNKVLVTCFTMMAIEAILQK